MDARPGGPATKREPSPEGLGLNSEDDPSAVGAALNLRPLANVSLGDLSSRALAEGRRTCSIPFPIAALGGQRSNYDADSEGMAEIGPEATPSPLPATPPKLLVQARAIGAMQIQQSLRCLLTGEALDRHLDRLHLVPWIDEFFPNQKS
jgi:hypothetical protein